MKKGSMKVEDLERLRFNALSAHTSIAIPAH